MHWKWLKEITYYKIKYIRIMPLIDCLITINTFQKDLKSSKIRNEHEIWKKYMKIGRKKILSRECRFS